MFKTFGVMIDCSRNGVASPSFIKTYIDYLSAMGYNALMLYTEETYEIEGEPFFGYQRGRYTKEELKDLDAYASSHGVMLIPFIQTLGHLRRLLRWPEYSDVADTKEILLCDEEKTYALIRKMFQTLSECFSSKLVHIGMDEADDLGRGQYETLHGEVDKTDLLLSHLNRVSGLAAPYGFKLLMWSDMFFRLDNGGSRYLSDAPYEGIPAVLRARIPENVELVYWDYYFTDEAHFDTQIQYHNQIKPLHWYAGGAWTWTGTAPHNRFTIDELKASVAACQKAHIENVFITTWGDDGSECSRLSVLPSLWAAACFNRGQDVDKAGFEKLFGITFDDFMCVDLPGTPNDEADIRASVDKYALYNDPFMGLLDSGIEEGYGARYADAGLRLAELSRNPAFGHVFGTLSALCSVLEIKCELGQRTRHAYQSHDLGELQSLIEDYSELIRRLDAFYHFLDRQWQKENKPQGFEVQDLRIGGLMKRVEHCRARLVDYFFGKIERIEELEEALLPYKKEAAPYLENRWERITSASNLY